MTFVILFYCFFCLIKASEWSRAPSRNLAKYSDPTNNECYIDDASTNIYTFDRADVVASLQMEGATHNTTGPRYHTLFCKQGYYIRGATAYWDTTQTGWCYDNGGIVYFRPVCASLYNRMDMYECPIQSNTNIGNYGSHRLICNEGDFMVGLRYREDYCRRGAVTCPCDSTGIFNIGIWCQKQSDGTFYEDGTYDTTYGLMKPDSEGPFWFGHKVCPIDSYACGVQQNGTPTQDKDNVNNFQGIWFLKWGCCKYKPYTYNPSDSPTPSPTPGPTDSPSPAPSNAPTINPTKLTKSPTNSPTPAPSIAPSDSPTSLSEAPTPAPSYSPTLPTDSPTNAPSIDPTPGPTNAPSPSPTPAPTDAPTFPTDSPSPAPTLSPTKTPTIAPTDSPIPAPTNAPTIDPTPMPTPSPTDRTKAPVISPQKGATATLFSGGGSDLIIVVIILALIICCLTTGILLYCRNKKMKEEVEKHNFVDMNPIPSNPPSARNSAMVNAAIITPASAATNGVINPNITNSSAWEGERTPQPPHGQSNGAAAPPAPPTQGQLPTGALQPNTAGGVDKALDMMVEQEDWDEKEMDAWYEKEQEKYLYKEDQPKFNV